MTQKEYDHNPYRTRLFTYGTLKKGGRLEGMVGDADYLGEYFTLHSVFDMIDYKNAFPIVFRKYKEGKSIKGHLYEVDLSGMDIINRMETNAEYTPMVVDIINEQGNLTNALMFVNAVAEQHTDAMYRAGSSDRNIKREKGYVEWQH